MMRWAAVVALVPAVKAVTAKAPVLVSALKMPVFSSRMVSAQVGNGDVVHIVEHLVLADHAPDEGVGLCADTCVK